MENDIFFLLVLERPQDILRNRELYHVLIHQVGARNLKTKILFKL
jgi:hypothetical protein